MMDGKSETASHQCACHEGCQQLLCALCRNSRSDFRAILTINLEILCDFVRGKWSIWRDCEIACDSYFAFSFLNSVSSEAYPIIRGSDLVESIYSEGLTICSFNRLVILGGNPVDCEKFRTNIECEVVSCDLAKLNLSSVADSLKKVTCGSVPLILVALPFNKAVGLLECLQKMGAKGTFVTIGGGLSLAVGSERRAPEVIRRLALEWLWRSLFGASCRWRRLFRTIIFLPQLFRQRALVIECLTKR